MYTLDPNSPAPTPSEKPETVDEDWPSTTMTYGELRPLVRALGEAGIDPATIRRLIAPHALAFLETSRKSRGETRDSIRKHFTGGIFFDEDAAAEAFALGTVGPDSEPVTFYRRSSFWEFLRKGPGVERMTR
jgi:hypothetical protein